MTVRGNVTSASSFQVCCERLPSTCFRDVQSREHKELLQRESSLDRDRRRDRDHRHRSGRDSKPTYHSQVSKDDRERLHNESRDKYPRRSVTEIDHGQVKEEGE